MTITARLQSVSERGQMWKGGGVSVSVCVCMCMCVCDGRGSGGEGGWSVRGSKGKMRPFIYTALQL